VSLGDDFVKEFIMFSYDVPLSKHFATRAYNTFADRFKKILQVHPGFDQLTETEQVQRQIIICISPFSTYAFLNNIFEHANNSYPIIFCITGILHYTLAG
jgi:hypothetical protein